MRRDLGGPLFVMFIQLFSSDKTPLCADKEERLEFCLEGAFYQRPLWISIRFYPRTWHNAINGISFGPSSSTNFKSLHFRNPTLSCSIFFRNETRHSRFLVSLLKKVVILLRDLMMMKDDGIPNTNALSCTVCSRIASFPYIALTTLISIKGELVMLPNQKTTQLKQAKSVPKFGKTQFPPNRTFLRAFHSKILIFFNKIDLNNQYESISPTQINFYSQKTSQKLTWEGSRDP